MQFRLAVIALFAAAVNALPAATDIDSSAQLVDRATSANCAAAQKLAQGIQDNIAVQQDELTSLAAVKTAVSANPVNMATFNAAKNKLLDNINKGISIRENNQKIAPAGNGAIAGLATVANAQAAEKSLATGLKGTTADLTSIATLQKDFTGGIAQNQKNKAAALQGC